MVYERVSVVVPARNEAATVGSVVASLRGHPSVDEIIVVDSASTDDTAIQATSEGARVIRLEQPGFGRAVKAGIEASRNRWIFKLDADMTNVSSDWLSRALERLDDNVGLVKAYWMNPDDPLPMTNLALKPTIKLLIPDLSHIRMPTSGIYLFNRTLLEGAQLADDFVFDLELLVRIYRLGYEIRQVDLGVVLDTLKPVSNYIDISSALLTFLHNQGRIERSGPVMVVLAHARYPETWCGGTILKYLSAGSTVDLWIPTGDSKERRDDNPLYDMYSNCSLNFLSEQKVDDLAKPEMVESLVTAIEKVRPKTLITHHHSDDHPQHRSCYGLVRNACLQLDRNVTPITICMCNSPSSVAPSRTNFRANIFIDISTEAELKYRFIQLGATHDGDDLLNKAKALDSLNGARCGVIAAEAYERVSLPLTLPAQDYF